MAAEIVESNRVQRKYGNSRPRRNVGCLEYLTNCGRRTSFSADSTMLTGIGFPVDRSATWPGSIFANSGKCKTFYPISDLPITSSLGLYLGNLKFAYDFLAV